MPELPDVEGFRRIMDRAVGHRVGQVDVRDDAVLRDADASTLRDAVSDRCFSRPHRHGKWLVCPLRSGRRHRKDEPSVVFHFGMTGKLVWSGGSAAADDGAHRHDRVIFVTNRGTLHYRDMRKLQGIRLARDDNGVENVIGEAGPDAGDISLDDLRDRLGSRRRKLKPALMDQSVVAGLGNLTVDEILWRARIHPDRSTRELSEKNWRELYREMRSTLRRAIPAGRVPDAPSWLAGHRDEKGEACPRCGTPLRFTRVAGRSTVWCPSCQPPP